MGLRQKFKKTRYQRLVHKSFRAYARLMLLLDILQFDQYSCCIHLLRLLDKRGILLLAIPSTRIITFGEITLLDVL